jgi:hypothetical protein
MRILSRSPFLAVSLLAANFGGPLLAQTAAPTPALGIVVRSSQASIGTAAASDGATIYSGDYLSTQENGMLLVRVGTLSLELDTSSALHIYRAPYGAVIELNRGSVIYTTPGGKENLVIVASDVRVTPDVSRPDLGRVSIDNPCEVTVYSQRGQANAQVGKESRTVEETKAYHVRADNKISYREYLSPDDVDYHRHHEHEPCPAILNTARNTLPIGAMGGHFALAAAAVGVPVLGVIIWKAVESPDHP